MNARMIAGIVLAIVSFVLMVVARLQLGKSFSVRPQAKELVTRGLYSKIRNPMYLFLDLAILGIILAIGHWYLLTILLILVPLQIIQSSGEEKVLRANFGTAYEAYRRKVWF